MPGGLQRVRAPCQAGPGVERERAAGGKGLGTSKVGLLAPMGQEDSTSRTTRQTGSCREARLCFHAMQSEGLPKSATVAEAEQNTGSFVSKGEQKRAGKQV